MKIKVILMPVIRVDVDDDDEYEYEENKSQD